MLLSLSADVDDDDKSDNTRHYSSSIKHTRYTDQTPLCAADDDRITDSAAASLAAPHCTDSITHCVRPSVCLSVSHRYERRVTHHQS